MCRGVQGIVLISGKISRGLAGNVGQAWSIRCKIAKQNTRYPRPDAKDRRQATMLEASFRGEYWEGLDLASPDYMYDYEAIQTFYCR